MTDEAWRELLNLLMCSDPEPCGLRELKQWADGHAKQLGYKDWVHAYHEDHPDPGRKEP